MKIFKWVPISNSEQKKKLVKNGVGGLGLGAGENKENTRKSSLDNTSQNFGLTTEDSNTCMIFWLSNMESLRLTRFLFV